MTNRRSILSTLCTGALALLAPVVAWAKPRRWVGFHNRGVKPMVITPREDLTPEQLAEFKRLWERDVQMRCLSWDSFDPRNRISTPLPDGVVAITETHLMATYQRERTLTTHNAELRALLAEARDMIYENVMVRRFRIGTGEATYEGYLQDTLAQADLHTRIDATLKGHEHA